MSQINTSFLYYLVLLFGTAFIGIYFWIIITAVIPDLMIRMVFILTGFIVVASTLSIGTATTRSQRTLLTAVSGIVGGVHAYFDIILSTNWLDGTFWFFWFFFGLLMAAAALTWLPETDD